MRSSVGFKIAAVTAVVVCLLFAVQPTDAADGGDSDVPSFKFDVGEYGERWIVSDRDDDGRTDYAIYVDEDNVKVREAVDFNNDGHMDDFYFYDNEVLERQEVDTNYDQSIDLWVYMHRGVWVERYERDTDHDGEPDVVRNFDDTQRESPEEGEREGEEPAQSVNR